MLRLRQTSIRPRTEKGWTKCNHGILEASAMLRGFCPHIMAGLRGLRTYTMKGSLLIGTSLLLLNVCAEAVAQNADYPLQALREVREGTSHFSVTVGTDGRRSEEHTSELQSLMR